MVRTTHNSKLWYFQPAFFVKVLWAIFAISLSVILIVFSCKEDDPFWKTVVGTTPLGLLVSSLFFYLIVLIATIVVFMGLLNQFRKVALIAIIGVTVLVYILGFAFVGKYGTIAHRTEYCAIVEAYYNLHKNETTEAMTWFKKNVHKTTDLVDDVFGYVDERTEDIGSAIIGCFIVWGFFDGIWMYMLFNGDGPEWNKEAGYEATE